MQNSLIFIVRTLADLYLVALLLRFVLQWVRGDFRNPVAQFVLTVTNPVVLPARRIVPSAAGIDLATLVVLCALECVTTWVLLALVGFRAPLGSLLLYTLLRLVSLTLWFYTGAIFIYAILSWFSNRSYNPMSAILSEIVEPLLRPVRRLLPPVAGFDLSPVLVMIALQAVLISLRVPPYLS